MIEVRGLVKYYGDHRAVAGVDFDLESGHVVGFLGLNGAGKTTILRVLAGDLEPSAGSVRVDGRDLLEDPQEYRRRVGFLPETVPLYPDLTVTEYLRYVGQLRGLSGNGLEDRIRATCGRVAIARYADSPIRHLSHGYQKRLGIGSAIVHEPQLVILDEAISGLDPVQIVEMRKLVRGLAGKHTVLVSSHILTEISQTCDEILVIADGTIAARGTEEELLRRLGDTHVVALTLAGDRKAAEAAVRGVDGVASVEVTREEAGEVQLAVTATADVRAELARAAVEAGLGVLRMVRAEGELEAAFLELTRPHVDKAGPKAGEEAA